MPSRRKIAFLLLACVVVLAAYAGCGDDGAGNPESKAVDYDKALAGAPPKLAALYEQGDALLDGGTDAFESQLADLRGHPVVVNSWASWCGPCRFEFPFFQSQAAEHGKRVAFLGIDSDDTDAKAETFLKELPLPYPSFKDPDKEIVDVVQAPYLPSTTFYDADGELVYTHIGGYASEDDLVADIDRYAS
jgi:thiol-disulfide isomerase/thioredoxin